MRNERSPKAARSRSWRDHPVLVIVFVLAAVAAIAGFVLTFVPHLYEKSVLQVRVEWSPIHLLGQPNKDLGAYVLLTNSGQPEIVITNISLAVQDPRTGRDMKYAAYEDRGGALDVPITIAAGHTVAKYLRCSPGLSWPIVSVDFPAPGDRLAVSMWLTLRLPNAQERLLETGLIDVVAEPYELGGRQQVRTVWRAPDPQEFVWKRWKAPF